MTTALNRFDDIAFGDVKTRTDLRAFRQGIGANHRATAACVSGQDQRIGIFRQWNTVQHQLQQIAVIAGITDQHGTEQRFIVFADHQAFVQRFGFIQINVAACARRAGMRVADTGHIHA
ncbi:hypothetical protein SRABI106_00468 [Rahnella aquatilis]|nr:hypothetical protein SRABI106_00468 [Rahnella aquatilis]